MRGRISKWMALMGIFVLFANLGAMLAPPFEGTTWKITVVPDEDARKAGEKGFDDIITFKGGMFSSENFTKRGFTPARFDEDVRQYGPATFKVTAKSEKAGETNWTGVIAATSIRGDITLKTKDDKTMAFSFTGERSAK